LFFVEFRLDFWRRWRFWNWNVFRWRRWLIRWRLVQRSLDSCRRDIGGIDWRRFFVEGNCDSDSVHK
jgi:hypothetical protein